MKTIPALALALAMAAAPALAEAPEPDLYATPVCDGARLVGLRVIATGAGRWALVLPQNACVEA